MKDKLLLIWRLLSKKRRGQLIFNLFLMISSGFSEIISLVLLTPFINYLLLGEGEFEFNFLNFLKVNDVKVLSILVILSFISSGFIRTLNLFINTRMAALIGNDLSLESYSSTLNRNYLWHRNNNTSKILAVIANHTNVSSQVFGMILQMATSFVVLISLTFTLLIIEWKYGNISVICFTALYYFLIFKSKNKLLTNSYDIVKYTNLHIKNIKETFNSIKEIKLNNNEKFFSKKFNLIDLNMRKKIAINQFIAGYPRFAIESLGITIFALIALISISLGENNSRVLAGIALVVVASQKILPSMQQVYASWAYIKSNTGAVDEVLKYCGNNIETTYNNSKHNNHLKVFKSIEVNLKEFTYPNKKRKILSNIFFKIEKGEFVAIVGESGKGKSTLLDIILSLLEPTKGYIKVNDLSLRGDNNINIKKNWHNLIAHVPQNPILLDSSIEENITFGQLKRINKDKLKNAAKLSNILDFIDSQPNKFKSLVGENGSKISGGQRQRIAIARALYKESKVILLDEPTSSLDHNTGQEIIKTLVELKEKGFTIIIVTHNINDIKKCDKIIKL